jgi:pyruvate,water dikinase
MGAALNMLKKWFGRKSRVPEPLVSLAPPVPLLERYGHYKLLLTANSAILTILADLQTKMNEGFLFDMHYVRSACSRLGEEVETLVRVLIAMAQGRYQALEAARREVAENIWHEFAVAEMKPVPLAQPLAQVTEGQFFGGKAEKLGEVARLGLPVPPGFAVSAYAQKLFFVSAGLEDFIQEAVSRANIRDLDSLRQAGAAIRERILAAPLPPELSQSLAAELERLGAPRVSVRSSALQEDSQVSFAGQFESVLNVPRHLVGQRYKEVIASQFTPRALYYCHTSGFSYQELAMGVLVMKMLEARAAGVLYTADPRQGEAATVINAVWGLGSVAVGGHVDPDVYRVEEEQLISQRVGEKAHMHICAAEGGVLETDLPPELKGPALKEPQVLRLAVLGAAVEKHFGLPQDIEWALGPQGDFYLLQARPLRLGRPLKAEYLPPRLRGADVLLGNGIIASRGAAAGPVHLLKGEEVRGVPQGAVLVTRRALPEYGLAADKLAAVVCEMGSATSHLATVLREAGVPAIFGAKGATTLLTPGSMVTVDAYYGNIYAGRREELLKAPKEDAILRQSRAWKMLERVLRHITPLHLLDPRGENFCPEACRTYHDITRFAHEKAMDELFQVSQTVPVEAAARQLESNIPVEIHVIDLGGGLRPEAACRLVVRPEDLKSRPMVAYWRGVSAIGWKGPKPVDLAGFMSVVMGSATGTNVQERLKERNYAIIAADYMNFSSRLGYHFATIDSYLGTPEESYVSLTFYGGGAELTRRIRRIHFLTKVLRHLDFRVELKGDSLSARLDGYDAGTLEEKLEVLGRLIMVSKQLDMTMEADDLVEHYYQEFITEGYNLNI